MRRPLPSETCNSLRSVATPLVKRPPLRPAASFDSGAAFASAGFSSAFALARAAFCSLANCSAITFAAACSFSNWASSILACFLAIKACSASTRAKLAARLLASASSSFYVLFVTRLMQAY